MHESNSKPENLDKAQEAEASSEVVVQDKRRKRAFFFAVAAIASFIAAWICLTFSILCFKSLGRGWDVLGSLLVIVSALLFVAVPVFGIMACVVPLGDKKLIQRERFTRASRISFLIGIMFCLPGVFCGPVYFPAFLFFVCGFVLSMISHAILFKDRKVGRICAIAAIIFLLFGSGTFFAAFCLRHRFLVIPALPLLTTAVVLAIVVHIISFRSKQLRGRLWSITAIFLLTMLLVILVPTGLNSTLPYVYTPPALTSENLVVYNECIEFAKEHDEYKNLMLWRGLLFNGHEMVDIQESFSKDDAIEIDTLYNRLNGVRCAKFQRDNDMLLFYKVESSIMPLDPGFRYVFVPAGPGVLYSLNGRNPNEIDSEVLNPCKPFIKIGGDWYMSKHLMLSGIRLKYKASNPKSLIDHSLLKEGFNLDDGDE